MGGCSFSCRCFGREVETILRSSVVLTFDLDFGDVLALGVLDKPSVIIFRLADERPESLNQRLDVVLKERSADLESGALILVEDTRYRVRRLPIGRADRS
jgi:predicted nuclease of predicted toxin-antitoxin system